MKVNELKVEYRPIGVVHSTFHDVGGMPIQPSRARGIKGRVEVFPEYADGLDDLDGFSHIILICHLHQSKGFNLKVIPFLDTVTRGLFSTRAPRRPNPIGLSIVRLDSITGTSLTIDGVDLLDQTPVLDIKPFIREFDEHTQVRCGWLDAALGRKVLSDERFR